MLDHEEGKIKRRPFGGVIAERDDGVLFDNPPRLVRMGTILVLSILVGLVLAITSVEYLHTVPIMLAVKEISDTRAANSKTAERLNESSPNVLHAVGYLSEIKHVRVGQTVRIDMGRCNRFACEIFDGTITSVTFNVVRGFYVVCVDLQPNLIANAVVPFRTHTGREFYGLVLTTHMWLPDHMFELLRIVRPYPKFAQLAQDPDVPLAIARAVVLSNCKCTVPFQAEAQAKYGLHFVPENNSIGG